MEPSTAPAVSVVVTTDRGATSVIGCLDALVATAGAVSHEIILVDSGDITDVSLDAIAERYDLTVACSTDRGPLLAANVGTELVTGQVVVFLSPHTRVRQGWLEALVAVLEARPEVGVVGPKLVGEDGLVAAAGWTVADDGTVTAFGRGLSPTDPEVNAGCPVDVLSRACFAIRTATWRGLGGFDAQYAPEGFEDADLCFAARSIGWEVRYQPASEVSVDSAADLFGAWTTASHRRFAAKWRAALVHQEPSPAVTGHPPVTADRSRRPVELRKPRRRGALRSPGGAALVVPAAGDSGTRATTIAAGFTAGGRPTVSVAEDDQRWAAGAPRWASPTIGVVWLDGLGVVDRLAVPVREAYPEALVVADISSLTTTTARRRAVLGERGVADWASRAEALERWLLRIPDLVVTTSDGAGREIGELLPDAEVLVVPLSAAPGGPARLTGRAGVAMAVDVHRSADLDAAQWLCREVMPRARMADRELIAVLVGDPSAPPLRALAGPGVQILAPDAAGQVLDRAVVAAAPWRYGSGMQQWALDAMAAGVPLAGTPIGCEGLAVRPGRQALVAEDADGLARAIVSVATDGLLWGALSEAGQDHVRDEGLTPAALVERLRGLDLAPQGERATT